MNAVKKSSRKSMKAVQKAGRSRILTIFLAYLGMTRDHDRKLIRSGPWRMIDSLLLGYYDTIRLLIIRAKYSYYIQYLAHVNQSRSL